MDYKLAHFNMIEQQIRPWDVLDIRILDTMAALPRHHFVPAGFERLAYSESPIPLSKTSTMLEPKIVGRFLQALNPESHERVLEIGTGSGYLTALLAGLCAQVTSIDIDSQLSEAAAHRLAALGIQNVHIQTGEAQNNWNDNQHYHAIVLTAALSDKPKIYLEKLEIGGRLVAVIGNDQLMEAICYTRTENNHWTEEVLFETQLPYLQGANLASAFTF